MKKVLLGIMGASALVLSTASLAGGPDMAAPVAPTQQTGVYVSAGLGIGNVESMSITNGTGTIVPFEDKTGFAWIASLGYQFTPNFAAEVGYFKLPTAKFRFGGNSLDHELDALYMAGKAILPVSDKVDVFGKAGIARMDQTFEREPAGLSVNAGNDLVFLGGVGADYYVTNNLAVTVQALATLKGTNTPSTYLATAGLSYKFAV